MLSPEPPGDGGHKRWKPLEFDVVPWAEKLGGELEVCRLTTCKVYVYTLLSGSN